MTAGTWIVSLPLNSRGLNDDAPVEEHLLVGAGCRARLAGRSACVGAMRAAMP
jgi:hypothetical protein